MSMVDLAKNPGARNVRPEGTSVKTLATGTDFAWSMH